MNTHHENEWLRLAYGSPEEEDQRLGAVKIRHSDREWKTAGKHLMLTSLLSAVLVVFILWEMLR